MLLVLSWSQGDALYSAPLFTLGEVSKSPKLVVAIDDQFRADDFYRQASEGVSFVWNGDFHNAKNLLQAVQRRIDKQNVKRQKEFKDLRSSEIFYRHRQSQNHKSQILNRLLIPIDGNLKIKLNRAPDVTDVLKSVSSQFPESDFLLSLRELLGYIGAYEWQKKGVHIESLDAKIHPHFGVFSPIRGEYLDLLAIAPLPEKLNLAWDIGTGTGVIAALLAKRGFDRVIASENNDAAVTCAVENMRRLGLSEKVQIVKTNVWPSGPKPDLIVCNPPWLPLRPHSALETALYDENGKMLKWFLSEVREHLLLGSEAWLIMSDLAERLELRAENEIETLIQKSGLKLIDKNHVAPKHKKTQNQEDPLYFARAKELTSLWRFKKQ